MPFYNLFCLLVGGILLLWGMADTDLDNEFHFIGLVIVAGASAFMGWFGGIMGSSWAHNATPSLVMRYSFNIVFALFAYSILFSVVFRP